MYRKEQQDEFFHKDYYITCGLVKKWTASEEMKVSDKMKECKDSFRFKPDHAKERVISNAAFVMAPFHFVCDQIERSETFLYLSLFGQMFSYVLYCPNIAKCPWVLEMLGKNKSNGNLDLTNISNCVECLVLLHSPFITDMKEMEALFKTINVNDGEKDENNDGKNDENNVSREDVSNVETQMDAIKKYCSSFVFVTGCMYTENDDNFCWLHSYIIY
jgi:hypothetical protein